MAVVVLIVGAAVRTLSRKSSMASVRAGRSESGQWKLTVSSPPAGDHALKSASSRLSASVMFPSVID